MNWKNFFAGLAVGFLIAVVAGHFIGQRYRIQAHGPSGMMVIRLDTWTGRSWIQHYYEKDGRKNWYWDPVEDPSR